MNGTKKGLLALSVGAVLVATGCTGGKSTPNPQSEGQAQTIQAFKQQETAVPYPLSQLTDSTERRNLREKLLRFNQPNRIGYVYILSLTGKPIGYYTIEGKVSSNSSQMTTSQLTIHTCGYHQDYCTAVVDGPQDDGSYGGSEPGIFFFTTEGALIQTDQNYLYSDQPIPTFETLPKLNGKGTVKDLTNRQGN